MHELLLLKILINTKNITNDAASVLRYSSAFNNEENWSYDPADRGLGVQDNQSIKETILTYEDLTATNSVSSVESKGYIKKAIRMLIPRLLSLLLIENGKRNDTDSLDWKYNFPVEDNPTNQKDRIHRQHVSPGVNQVSSLGTNDAQSIQDISIKDSEIVAADVTTYDFEYIYNEVNGLLNANNDGSSPVGGTDLTSTFATNGNAQGREEKSLSTYLKTLIFSIRHLIKFMYLKTDMHLFQIPPLMWAILG